MLYPILPVFLTQTLKASGTIVGLVDGVAQAAQNIVQGFSGALSDKLQKRKPVALAGYLMAAAAKPLMGLSSSWQGVFGARFLDRLGAGTRSAPRDALIASSVDEKDRGRAFILRTPMPSDVELPGLSINRARTARIVGRSGDDAPPSSSTGRSRGSCPTPPGP